MFSTTIQQGNNDQTILHKSNNQCSRRTSPLWELYYHASSVVILKELEVKDYDARHFLLVIALLGIGTPVASVAIIWRAIQIIGEFKFLVVITGSKFSPSEHDKK